VIMMEMLGCVGVEPSEDKWRNIEIGVAADVGAAVDEVDEKPKAKKEAVPPRDPGGVVFRRVLFVDDDGSITLDGPVRLGQLLQVRVRGDDAGDRLFNETADVVAKITQEAVHAAAVLSPMRDFTKPSASASSASSADTTPARTPLAALVLLRADLVEDRAVTGPLFRALAPRENALGLASVAPWVCLGVSAAIAPAEGDARRAADANPLERAMANQTFAHGAAVTVVVLYAVEDAK